VAVLRRGWLYWLMWAGVLAGCAGNADKSTDGDADSGARHPAAAPQAPAAPLVGPRKTAEAPPPGAARRSAPYTTIRVFYGTNRLPTGDAQPARFYGTQAGPLSFGYCDVSIPPNHLPGELESPKLWKFEFREDPQQHVVLLRVEPAGGPEFITELQRAVWNSIEWRRGNTIVGGEVLVFVHGFNNSFEDAARRTAQIVRDVGFRGAPVMFSWPSQGSATLRGYQADGQQVGWSEDHFLKFIAGVARESGARRIHVVAHSMGNRLVSESLRKLSLHFASGQLPRLSQVVLTAPDIDADYFKTAIAPRIAQTAERITIYSSSRDLALKASSFANQLGKRRLGEAGNELSTFPNHRNIEVIDASTVETDLFGLNHSYHASSTSVLHDIELVLSGAAPGERGLQALLGTLAWKIRGIPKSIRQAGHTVVR
jgi:esterase/lipase superfamily enzyme